MYPDYLAGKCWSVGVDNSNCVAWVNKHTVKGDVCFDEAWAMLEELFLLGVQYNFRLCAHLLPSAENKMADALSREDWGKVVDLLPEWQRCAGMPTPSKGFMASVQQGMLGNPVNMFEGCFSGATSEWRLDTRSCGSAFFSSVHRAGGLILFEPFGGLMAGLRACLAAGIRVVKYVYCDIDPKSRAVARHQSRLLCDQYPNLLHPDAVNGMLDGPQDIYMVDERALSAIGVGGAVPVMIIAGWECQDLSPAGSGLGIFGPRSKTFWELVRVVGLAQQLHSSSALSFVLENTAFQHNWRSEDVRTRQWPVVCRIIGTPITSDAARFGSRAHRLRNYWVNLADVRELEAAMLQVHRPAGLLVQDILEPGRVEMPVRCVDNDKFFQCNKPGEPRAAWPTIMAAQNSWSFRPGQAGAVRVLETGAWVEPSVLERERALGYPDGSTAAPGIHDQHRRKMLGRSMDHNALVWLLTAARRLAVH
jgi:site-specific DNA-cytosine methylase